jgi:DNA-binding transcriptional LysR family regulator
MELRHLRYFVAIAEALSFRQAADRLGVAQPALSQQVRQLESELGVLLFDRTRRRVRLTQAGEVFADRARTLLSGAEEAAEAAREAGRGQTGRLSIGVVTSALYGVFPDVVRVFRNRYPKVHIDLHELPVAHQAEWLRNGRIDASFLRPPIDSQGLVVQGIAEEPWVAAAPANHPLAGRRRVPLKALAGEPFVIFPRNLAPNLYDQLIAICQEAGFSPQISIEAQMQTIVNLVAAGLGIALVPGSLVNLRRKGLVYRALAGPTPPKVALAVAWRADDANPVLRNFLEVLDTVSRRPRRSR